MNYTESNQLNDDPLRITKNLLKVTQIGLIYMHASISVVSLVETNISRAITDQILDWEICRRIRWDLNYDPGEK